LRAPLRSGWQECHWRIGCGCVACFIVSKREQH
jgi:hypothetical protein